MEFLFSADAVHILFENATHGTRRIYIDGREWPKDVEATFTGYSIGKWLDTDGDGAYDTLEVETRDLRGPRNWDNSGMPMASDNDAVVKERISLSRENRAILQDEITTMDNSLTRPWNVVKHYRRLQHPTWIEHDCVEGNPHVGIGKEVYFLSGDGRLMPTRKDQQPPDLHYFNSSK
jgi:hypothetical protein